MTFGFFPKLLIRRETPGLIVAEMSHEQLAPHLVRSFELRSLLEQALFAREQAKRELDDFLNRW